MNLESGKSGEGAAQQLEQSGEAVATAGQQRGRREWTPEELEIIKKAKRRNLIFAIVLGIVLLVSGFLAGKALRAGHDAAVANAHDAAAVAADFMAPQAGIEMVADADVVA